LLYGAAAWAIFANKGSARALGLIASTSPALIFLGAAHRFHIAFVPWISIGVAVAGLIAFLPRSAPQSASRTTTPVRIPGDGTIPWMRTAVWAVGGVGFIYGLNWWWGWARAQGLPWDRGVSFYLQLVLVDLAVVLLHELGHAITGLALGMKLRAFIVGPFQWRISDGKWGFKFSPAGFFSAGGATALVPTNPRQPPSEKVCMIAAGPFASVASGILALCAAFIAPGQPWEPAWLLLACFGVASVLVGVLNLIPFQTRTSYSDGAQIYQLLSGGPWADYHRVLAVMGSTLVTPLRPRDYDIEAIKRAALHITQGSKAILLNLLASNYHLDRGEFHEAAFFFSQADLVRKNCGTNQVPSGWYTVFAFREAFLRHDAREARAWWERYEATKSTRQNVDYWLARAALLWAEKSFGEAWLALEKAEEAGRQLPKFGAYEFDRYRCELLRKAVTESANAKREWESAETSV
ncbi:MAG TPA: M50 family metallopeptidase, partial [Acidobacteriaceae bacterium]|nr:M50 family metallopeptidase [Acidobacteriaceae bacterium]